jgi:peptidoglycan hydrolase-like protein with peptidoglycan-binding domain
MTVRAEQRWLKNRDYYKGRIDGQFGPLSVKGLQKLMNSQQSLYK